MKPNNRLGSISVGKLQFMLTPRDVAIIKSVRLWRFLSTAQIYALHFADHASYVSGIRACTRVLARLCELRLLRRLERPVGGLGGGSTSFIWSVDTAGDRLVRADADSGFVKRFRPYEPTSPFLLHTLAIADVRVRLETLSRSGQLEILAVQPEPACWRSFTWAGRSQTLKPDLYVETAVGDEEMLRYVEIDRSTESLQVLVEKKARAYEDYLATGIDEAQLGIVPEVLWVVLDHVRARQLRIALDGARGITSRLHKIITTDQLDDELLGRITNAPGRSPEEGGI